MKSDTFLYRIYFSISLIFSLFGFRTSDAQDFFRFKADFSIKKINADSTVQLTVGIIYFDKTENKTVYNVKYPEKQIWVLQDTILQKYEENKLIDSVLIPEFAENHSIFSMAFDNTLQNFGLENFGFVLNNTKTENSTILAEWIPEKETENKIKKILLSKNRNLNAVIVYSAENKIISKIFLEEYQNIKGIEFPCRILRINYFSDKKYFEKTEFSNIIINDFENDTYYNFPD